MLSVSEASPRDWRDPSLSLFRNFKFLCFAQGSRNPVILRMTTKRPSTRWPPVC